MIDQKAPISGRRCLVPELHLKRDATKINSGRPERLSSAEVAPDSEPSVRKLVKRIRTKEESAERQAPDTG